MAIFWNAAVFTLMGAAVGRLEVPDCTYGVSLAIVDESSLLETVLVSIARDEVSFSSAYATLIKL